MINTSGTVNDINRIINGLDRLAENVLKRTLQAGQDAAKSMVKGKLTDSLEKKILGHQGSLKTTKHYAKFVENGRGPITAKKGKVLRFKIAGQIIFAKHVKGVKPRPFMKAAGESMISKVTQIIKSEWDKLI